MKSVYLNRPLHVRFSPSAAGAPRDKEPRFILYLLAYECLIKLGKKEKKLNDKYSLG